MVKMTTNSVELTCRMIFFSQSTLIEKLKVGIIENSKG